MEHLHGKRISTVSIEIIIPSLEPNPSNPAEIKLHDLLISSKVTNLLLELGWGSIEDRRRTNSIYGEY